MILTFIFIQHHSCYCPFCMTSSQSDHTLSVTRVWNALLSAFLFFVSQRLAVALKVRTAGSDGTWVCDWHRGRSV